MWNFPQQRKTLLRLNGITRLQVSRTYYRFSLFHSKWEIRKFRVYKRLAYLSSNHTANLMWFDINHAASKQQMKTKNKHLVWKKIDLFISYFSRSTLSYHIVSHIVSTRRIICYCHGKLSIGMTLKSIHDSSVMWQCVYSCAVYTLGDRLLVLHKLDMWTSLYVRIVITFFPSILPSRSLCVSVLFPFSIYLYNPLCGMPWNGRTINIIIR